MPRDRSTKYVFKWTIASPQKFQQSKIYIFKCDETTDPLQAN